MRGRRARPSGARRTGEARKDGADEDPIGRTAEVTGKDARVIGVIADVHESSVEGHAGWQMYLPATQFEPEGAQLVVRTKLPPEAVASSVMSTLRRPSSRPPRRSWWRLPS